MEKLERKTKLRFLFYSLIENKRTQKQTYFEKVMAVFMR